MTGHLGPVRTHLDNLTGFQGFDTIGAYATNPGRAGVGWSNDITGMGTVRDKTTYGVFRGYSPIDLISLSNLYHGSDLASRIIDVQADEAFRLPFKVSVGKDDVDQLLTRKFESLNARENLLLGCVWGRLFGGAWTVLGVDDGQEASQPLDLERARSVDWLQVVDRRFMWPISWYSEGPKAGKPDRYVLSQTWVGVAQGAYEIHETRMIRWPGARTAQREQNLNASYDYSVLDKCWPQLRMYETLWKGVELLIVEGPQAVYKVKGFADKLMADQGKALTTRMQMIDFYRSIMRAIVIDQDEEFERQPMQLAGIPDLLSQAAFRIAATAQIPMLVLFGQDAAGFSTGDSSLRWFWDKTKSYQTNVVGPKIAELAKLILQTEGYGNLIDDVVVTFEPLYTPSALERAQEIQAMATADKTYVDAQVLTPEEVALSRFTDQGTWSDAWKVDLKTRKKLLDDVMRNLAEGSAPGAVETGDIGNTPAVKDVRGIQQPEVSEDPAFGTKGASKRLRKDFDVNQERDDKGRWTGGGDVSKAGKDDATGASLVARSFKLTLASGEIHTFSDRPGEKDTYSFAADSPELDDAKDSEALERMYFAVHDMARSKTPAGYEYNGIKEKRGASGEKQIFHEFGKTDDSIRGPNGIRALVGTYRRTR